MSIDFHARLAAVVLCLPLLLTAPPAALAADDPPAKDRSPEALLDEATQTILRAFKLLLGSIPQYEAPEVLENGDIIIRRKHPAEEPAPAKPRPSPPGQSRT